MGRWCPTSPPHPRPGGASAPPRRGGVDGTLPGGLPSTAGLCPPAPARRRRCQGRGGRDHGPGGGRDRPLHLEGRRLRRLAVRHICAMSCSTPSGPAATTCSTTSTVRPVPMPGLARRPGPKPAGKHGPGPGRGSPAELHPGRPVWRAPDRRHGRLCPQPAGPCPGANQLAPGQRAAAGGSKSIGSDQPALELPGASHPRRLILRGSFEDVELEGVPGLIDPAVVGPHRSHRDGDVMVVEGELPREGHLRCTLSGPGVCSAWTVGQGDQSTLGVRMPPDMELIAEIAVAAAVRISGLDGQIRIRMETGSLLISQSGGPLDAVVSSGSLRLKGALGAQRSRIRCGTGSVEVVLDEGSDIDVRASARVGTARVAGAGGEQVAGAGQRCRLAPGQGRRVARCGFSPFAAGLDHDHLASPDSSDLAPSCLVSTSASREGGI